MRFFGELKRRNVLKVGVAYSVACWLLFQIVDLVLIRSDAPDWVMQAFLLVAVIGLPIAIISAWVFELTPEGIRLTKNVEQGQSINRHTGHQLNRGIIMILSMAVVLFFTDRFREEIFVKPGNKTGEKQKTHNHSDDTPAVDSIPSIAVLPFQVTGATRDQSGLGEDFTVELLNALVKTGALDVASGTLVFSPAVEDPDVPAIAARLAVDYLLEGNVLVSGQQIQVTAHLIEVSKDVYLWSETYVASIDETGNIQKKISHEISTVLDLQPAL